MSDFISDLRTDLVDAADRQRRRGRVGRAARPLHPRSWRPAAVVAAAAVAAAAAAIVLAVTALAPPAQRAGRPHLVAVIRVGDTPVDAAFSDGSLWIADFGGTVVRIDQARARVSARITVSGQPEAIAAGSGAVWVRTPNAKPAPNAGGVLASHLLKIDPRTNRVVARVALGGGDGLAVGADSVWAARRFTMPEGIDRIDPSSGALTGRLGLANVDAIAEARGSLWAIEHDGTVVQVDTATGRVARRWPQLAPSDASATSAKLVAADDGVWVLSTAKSEILRIAAGRVAVRIPVDPSAKPLLARGRDGLWIAAGDDLGHRNRVIRLDPVTGKATATVDIADQRPTALVAAGRILYVITAAGNVLVIRS